MDCSVNYLLGLIDTTVLPRHPFGSPVAERTSDDITKESANQRADTGDEADGARTKSIAVLWFREEQRNSDRECND